MKIETISNAIDKMAELRANAESLACAYNDAFMGGELLESNKIKTELDKVIADYGDVARGHCFFELKSTGNPMIEAIKQLRYNCITATTKKEGEAKIPVLRIAERAKPIDIEALQKYCGGNIGIKADWVSHLHKMNYLLTARVIKLVSGHPDEALKKMRETYALSDIARKIEMGGTPLSDTQLRKALQIAVDAMIGNEYKVTKRNVDIMLEFYSKKSNKKALTLVAPNHRTFSSYFMEMCHDTLFDTGAEVEYKEKK